MHAHRIDIFDRADDNAIVGGVAHHLHLELFPAQNRLLDQHLADRRRVEPGLDNIVELGAVVSDPAAGAAEGKRGADNGRQAGVLDRVARLFQRFRDPAYRAFQADLFHRIAE